MAKSYQQLQQKPTFDEITRFLDAQFETIPDHRASNAWGSLDAVLKSALARFSLKAPALLDFKQQTLPEASNLKTIYRIDGEIPCDNQMRGMLDPQHLRPLYRACFLKRQQAGVMRDYYYWQKFVIVSIDGVEHWCSTKVHCPHCTRRTHRNGAPS